jgi:hypothetical protein
MRSKKDLLRCMQGEVSRAEAEQVVQGSRAATGPTEAEQVSGADAGQIGQDSRAEMRPTEACATAGVSRASPETQPQASIAEGQANTSNEQRPSEAAPVAHIPLPACVPANGLDATADEHFASQLRCRAKVSDSRKVAC